MINTTHMIRKIIHAGILILQKAGKSGTIRRAAPIIVIKYNITAGRQQLYFCGEEIPIGTVWTTMNLQNQRVSPGRVKIWRGDIPSVDKLVVQ